MAKETAHPQISHNRPSVWVRKEKEKEMIELNLGSMLVVTRLMEYYSWVEVNRILEHFF